MAERKLKALEKRITTAVADTGLTALFGISPVGAARILGDVRHVDRFPSKHHFAGLTGTAPIEGCESCTDGQRVPPRQRVARYVPVHPRLDYRIGASSLSKTCLGRAPTIV